jgi:hypothetical protein
MAGRISKKKTLPSNYVLLGLCDHPAYDDKHGYSYDDGIVRDRRVYVSQDCSLDNYDIVRSSDALRMRCYDIRQVFRNTA